MIKNDAQLGLPFILYLNTKANIEALTAVEGMLAQATDTKQLYYFNGTNFVPIPVEAVSNIWTATQKFGSALNHIQIDGDGKLLLAGTATVFDDLTAPLIGLRIESPSSHIVINNTEGTVEFKTSCDLTDYLISEPQLTHRWKLGSLAHPHIHWEQTSATMPNWLIQFRWQKQGNTKTTSWTSQAYTTSAFTYVSGTLNQITSFGTITPPAGYGLSDVIDYRILRDVTNTSTLFAGADGLAASVYAKLFDTHVEMDTLGSNDEYAK